MKKSLSIILIAIPALIFISFSLRFFTWTAQSLGFFCGELIVIVGVPALITFAVHRFCRLARSTSLLIFACLYFLFQIGPCVERVKELDRQAAALREISKLCAPTTEEELSALQNKSYATNVYSDWAPILDYLRKQYIFSYQFANEWDDVRSTANINSMLSIDTLCDSKRLIESRKALETLYNRSIEIQRKTVNYHSNLYLILKDQSFKRQYLMRPRLKTCQRDSELHVNYAYDYFDNQRYLFFIIDDLYLFLLSLEGNYGHTDNYMQFSNDIEGAKYDWFMKKIDQLIEEDAAINNKYEQDQKTIEFS